LALVGNPAIVFAHEPTAALVAESGRSVVGMLHKLADQRETTVFMVTHRRKLAVVSKNRCCFE
jgi:putative ABC transport system ATP-binding protein